ncbi:MAG: PilT/PilU family type 4a pilus ATPase [Planctomycetota bacterium]
MDQQDAFTERIALHNKLVTPEGIAQAREAARSMGRTTLIEALVSLGLVTLKQEQAILAAYEKKYAPPSEKADSPMGRGSFKIHEYLLHARSLGASDLHISVGSPPLIRKHGVLKPIEGEGVLSAEDTEALLFDTLNWSQQEAIREKKSLDFSYAVEGQGRYRTCMVRQRCGWDGSFRVIQDKVPSFEELDLPPQLRRLTEYNQGLVLVTGPSGSGKSTTLAALVDLVNQSQENHIITIEDPVEYLFEPAKSQVSQREVPSHTRTFATALRAALREDPDVIMIGELRDLETVSLAITASETGHLVFGTLHTGSAARTIDRILDVFPADEQPQIRAMISESLRGIVCQQLIRRKDGKGRVLALEILFNNPAVANLIRERKTFQLPSLMQMGKKQGMILLDNALLDLLKAGVIDGAEAYYAADDKGRFKEYAPDFEGGGG